MRFSEMLSMNKTDKPVETKNLRDVGAYSFKFGKTDKNEVRTPHYEIDKCLEMFEDSPLIASGIEQMMLWLFPNEHLKFSSEKERDAEKAEEFFANIKGITDEVRQILQTNLICGNAPVDIRFNKKKELDYFTAYNDMSRIYVNPDFVSKSKDPKYIFQVAQGTKFFIFRGEKRTPNFYQVRYIQNYQWSMKSIYGIPIYEDELIIYQSGWSRDSIYGRSQLASAIDAFNIYTEILNSWDTIAKTRQLNQKILTLADSLDNPVQLDKEKIDKILEQLEESDKSYVFFDIPLKLLQQDINVSGGYDTMDRVFDIVRRMMTTSLLPNHLTPWSDSATTQGSESAMPPFMSRLKAKQNEFKNWFNENILSYVIEELDLDESTSLVIDEPKVLSDDGYIRTIETLMRSEILTQEEGKKLMVHLGIIPETIER